MFAKRMVKKVQNPYEFMRSNIIWRRVVFRERRRSTVSCPNGSFPWILIIKIDEEA
jgi:hypothetical protein